MPCAGSMDEAGVRLSPCRLLPGVKAWFAGYRRSFDGESPAVLECLDLKVEHTRGVCEAILDIGESLHLSDRDLCLAEISALLHDVGRFEQFRRYGTFVDCRSENHALLGAQIVLKHRVLDGLDPADAEVVLGAVARHNLAALPENEPERSLVFLKILRDADKLDIWRVVTSYYRNGGDTRNRAIELDLPDTDRVSAPVYEAVMRGETVQMTALETLQDFKLLQIGWVYDLHFPRSFQIAKERKYLDMIRSALPGDSPCITRAYRRACAHLQRHGAAPRKGGGGFKNPLPRDNAGLQPHSG